MHACMHEQPKRGTLLSVTSVSMADHCGGILWRLANIKFLSAYILHGEDLDSTSKNFERCASVSSCITSMSNEIVLRSTLEWYELLSMVDLPCLINEPSL